MAESWATLTSYTLHDLLMFSADTYFRLFEWVNRRWWPAPVVGAALAWAVLVSAWRRQAARTAWALLAAAWAAVALLYFRAGYAGIHWLGPGWMAAFLLQALLWLAWGATARPVHAAGGPTRVAGLVLLTAAAAWPLLAPLLRRPLWQAEVAGLAPDATLLLFLGLLLTMQPTRAWAAALLALPLAWCAFSGATLWAMAQPQAPILPLTGCTAVLALVLWRR